MYLSKYSTSLNDTLVKYKMESRNDYLKAICKSNGYFKYKYREM